MQLLPFLSFVCLITISLSSRETREVKAELCWPNEHWVNCGPPRECEPSCQNGGHLPAHCRSHTGHNRKCDFGRCVCKPGYIRNTVTYECVNQRWGCPTGDQYRNYQTTVQPERDLYATRRTTWPSTIRPPTYRPPDEMRRPYVIARTDEQERHRQEQENRRRHEEANRRRNENRNNERYDQVIRYQQHAYPYQNTDRPDTSTGYHPGYMVRNENSDRQRDPYDEEQYYKLKSAHTTDSASGLLHCNLVIFGSLFLLLWV